MHNHDHHGHSCGKGSETKNLGIAFFLNLGFSIIELFGGWLTNSVAILSDAVHDLGDSISIGIAWYLRNYAQKPGDERFSYGYRRFALIGAFLNAVILTIGSIFILLEALPRLWSPAESHVPGMIGLALLGIAANGIAFLRLRHNHSLNEKMVAFHLLEDILGWFAILAGAIVMYFFHLPVIDPILSILISLFILYNVFKSSSGLINIVLQASPDKELRNQVVEHLLSAQEVLEMHDLHLWSLDGQYHILTVHLVIPDELSPEDSEALKTRVRQELAVIGIGHATIELERESIRCLMELCN